MAGFTTGQKIIVNSGANSETVVVANVGTPGATTVGTATTVGATVIPVAGTGGLAAGQTITIDNGTNIETAVIASISGGPRGGGGMPAMGSASVTLTAPLTKAHEVGAMVSGSGITLAAPLTRNHASGTQVAGNIPTPGAANQYTRKP